MQIAIGEFQMEVLTAVRALRKDAYGTRIRDRIRKGTKSHVHMPQVYTALKRLEALGYLHSKLDDRKEIGRGRTRRLYQLSPPALKVLAASSGLHAAKELRHEEPPLDSAKPA